MEMKQARIIVSGKVQGVFFRAFAKQKAGKFCVTGWIRNRSDGDVEILVQGSKENIEKFARACKIGPLMAKVSGLKIDWESLEEECGYFDIRY